jgi:hypothetical protein
MKLVCVYCLVLGIVCPEQIVLVRLLNMYAILYLHIILLVLPDTFYLDESGSGCDRIRIRIRKRIRFVLRGRIRIRSKSVRIRNTDIYTQS